MFTRNQLYFLIFAVLVMVVIMWGPLTAGSTSAQGESFPASFSYQGQLKDGGVPVDGNYDFEFKLYDSASGGSQVGSTRQKTNVPVTDGIFTVELDFGPAAFEGESRWLEIQVRPAGTGSYTGLGPRQHITPTPYAMHAFSIADGAVTADKLADDFIDDLEAMIEDKVSESLGDLQSDLVVLQGQVTALEDTINDLETANDELQDRVSELEDSLDEHSNLMAGVTRQDVGGHDTMRFSGMNVQIVNGTGATDGTPDGLGNLIVGYNELRSTGNDRTGSHYIVVGSQNNYSSYGGIVAGYNNTASGDYSSVTGGEGNTASGDYSSVTGGLQNTASGILASVSGGYGNMASGEFSSAAGGESNIASGTSAWVTGGYFNTASGSHASVSGGGSNTASASASSILGGKENQLDTAYGTFPGESTANSELEGRVDELEDLLAGVTRQNVGGYDTLRFSGMNMQIVNGTGTTGGDPDGLGNLIVGYNALRATGNDRSGSHYFVVGDLNNYTSFGGIVAGSLNTGSGQYASVTGGWSNEASGDYASVTGGANNTASGVHASVTGGGANTASEIYASVSGGGGNTASGDFASVSGGDANTASGVYASVTGGYNNEASRDIASVSGGANNTASGVHASVSGGSSNTASGERSSVLGGVRNEASGLLASVTSGESNTASGDYSSVSGGHSNTASGIRASVTGGFDNEALGLVSSVSGGLRNEARAWRSSVSGGTENIALGTSSSILGGYQKSVTTINGIYPE